MKKKWLTHKKLFGFLVLIFLFPLNLSLIGMEKLLNDPSRQEIKKLGLKKINYTNICFTRINNKIVYCRSNDIKKNIIPIIKSIQDYGVEKTIEDLLESKIFFDKYHACFEALGLKKINDSEIYFTTINSEKAFCRSNDIKKNAFNILQEFSNQRPDTIRTKLLKEEILHFDEYRACIEALELDIKKYYEIKNPTYLKDNVQQILKLINSNGVEQIKDFLLNNEILYFNKEKYRNIKTLFKAISNHNLENVEKLFKKINQHPDSITDPNNGQSTLIYCIRKCFVEGVQFLLDKGADPARNYRISEEFCLNAHDVFKTTNTHYINLSNENTEENFEAVLKDLKTIRNSLNTPTNSLPNLHAFQKPSQHNLTQSNPAPPKNNFVDWDFLETIKTDEKKNYEKLSNFKKKIRNLSQSLKKLTIYPFKQ